MRLLIELCSPQDLFWTESSQIHSFTLILYVESKTRDWMCVILFIFMEKWPDESKEHIPMDFYYGF